MPEDISDKIKQSRAQSDVPLSAQAYAALIKMASDSMSSAPYRQKIRSAAAPCNDNPVGDVLGAQTAGLMGSLIKALDENTAVGPDPDAEPAA